MPRTAKSVPSALNAKLFRSANVEEADGRRLQSNYAPHALPAQLWKNACAAA
jgi:hypothetical protein